MINLEELQRIIHVIENDCESIDFSISKLIKEEVCEKCHMYEFCFPYPVPRITPSNPCIKYKLLKHVLLTYVSLKRIKGGDL